MDSKASLLSFGSQDKPLGMMPDITSAYNATQKMEPAVGFGSSTRPPLLMCTDTPGPGTYVIKTLLLGKCPDSNIKTTPQFSLRSREKFGSADLKAIDPTSIREPGPGHYDQNVVNINEKIAPKFSFPKSSFPKDKRKLAPGPGAYKLNSAVGKQVLSTKRSNQAVGFGKGNRPPLLAPSTSAFVGPGEYGVGVGACGKQVDSRKYSNNGVRFGKDARDKSTKTVLDTPNPGPGHYKLPSGMCGKGAAYPYRAGPRCSLSGREKFGSPF